MVTALGPQPRRKGAAMPSSQFEKLLPADRERIVAASLGEFAEHGYDQASTNRIVGAAAISKGVLFKYFADKASLFEYVADVSLRDYLRDLPDGAGLDVFEWIRIATAYKVRFMRQNPTAYRLWLRIMREPDHPVYRRVVARMTAKVRQPEMVGQWWETDRLRPGVTSEHIANLLLWITTGLQEKFVAMMPDGVDDELEAALQAVLDECEVYFQILRAGIYGEGEPS